jgi:hypothetical protein
MVDVMKCLSQYWFEIVELVDQDREINNGLV